MNIILFFLDFFENHHIDQVLIRLLVLKFLLILTLLLGLSFILYTTPQAFSFKTHRVEMKASYPIPILLNSWSKVQYN